MSMLAGQSLTPYPWRERKKHNDARRLIAPVVKLTRILVYIATIASPPSFIFWLWCGFGFRHYNDSWSKRGLITLLIGILSAVLFISSPLDVSTAWYDFMTSFGPESNQDTIQALVTAFLISLPYALIIQGVHALARSYQVEKTTNAFLKPQRPSLMMKNRKRRNIKQLRTGVEKQNGKDGYVRFGVVQDDRIPWRQSRYGMIVERKIERMGHGAFIGANGMGKTKAAETFTHYILKHDAAMIYIDFKASLGTMHGLANVAKESGRPCYILDIGFGTTDTSWYDLFAWEGSPSDKASVLVECFQFAEGEGGAAYYRGIAEAWLPMQIAAAELVGLKENEGMFDFLLDTAVPSRFQDRIEPMRKSDDPAIQEKFERWTEESNVVKTQDLQGLRNELTKIVNAAGSRLKPNDQNPNPVSIQEVMDNGGLVYIGIASGINDVVVKVLGSFLFKELSILVSSRSRVTNTDELRDVFVMPDEASEMEERSVMMNPIYTMAREARVFLWPLFQSFAAWDESTQEEIQANARNLVAFSIPSRETAETISSTIPDIFALQQMSEEQTKQQTFQNQTVGISGDTRLSVATDAFLRPNIELSQVPIYHAYIWFKDAPTIPRGKWRGKNRVRKDENRGDAPLVKLVPYDLVMTEGVEHDMDIVSDKPEIVQPVELPATTSSHTAHNSVTNPEKSADAPDADMTTDAGSDSWTDYVTTSHLSNDNGNRAQSTPASNPKSPQDQPSAQQQRPTIKDDVTGPPALPSFARRGASVRHSNEAEEFADTSSATDPLADASNPIDAATDCAPQEEPTSETKVAAPENPVGLYNGVDDDEFADDGISQKDDPTLREDSESYDPGSSAPANNDDTEWTTDGVENPSVPDNDMRHPIPAEDDQEAHKSSEPAEADPQDGSRAFTAQEEVADTEEANSDDDGDNSWFV